MKNKFSVFLSRVKKPPEIVAESSNLEGADVESVSIEHGSPRYNMRCLGDSVEQASRELPRYTSEYKDWGKGKSHYIIALGGKKEKAYQRIIKNLWDERQYFKGYVDYLMENIDEEEFHEISTLRSGEMFEEHSPEQEQLLFSCIISSVQKNDILPEEVSNVTGISVHRIEVLGSKPQPHLRSGISDVLIYHSNSNDPHPVLTETKPLYSFGFLESKT